MQNNLISVECFINGDFDDAYYAQVVGNGLDAFSQLKLPIVFAAMEIDTKNIMLSNFNNTLANINSNFNLIENSIYALSGSPQFSYNLTNYTFNGLWNDTIARPLEDIGKRIERLWKKWF